MSFNSYRSGQRSRNSEDSGRRTWRNRPSFTGARAPKNYGNEMGILSAPSPQEFANRGRQFFGENAGRQLAHEGAGIVSHSSMCQNTGSESSAWNYAGAQRRTLLQDGIERPWLNLSLDAPASVNNRADATKANFDTDLRFHSEARASASGGQAAWLKNPYRLIDPETSRMLDDALPILRSLKPSNPWQQSNNCSSSSSLQGTNTKRANDQPAQMSGNTPQKGRRVENSANCEATESTQNWNPQGNSLQSHSYFADLKQREQNRALFGKSGPSLLQTPVHDMAWGKVQNGPSSALNHFNAESAPTFGAVSARTSPLPTTNDRTSPGTPTRIARNKWRDPQFQTVGGYTWRTYAQPDQSRENVVPSPASDERATFEENSSLQGRSLPRHVPANVQDQLPQSTYRGAPASESQTRYTGDESGSQYPVSTRANGVQNDPYSNICETPSAVSQEEEERSLPDVTTMQFRGGASEADDVHEVDEGRLLPDGVDVEKLHYVFFFDISKKSFFEEVQKSFLPGSLLYFFYEDPSILLPTREHPFYKENARNWIYFYPECGTEYGGYQVAAPAVISWMDEKVPQRVKFLVHGHQKQLKLHSMLRKVIYYPTSRVVDVVLLNRMLHGDFDPQRPGGCRKVAAGALKTVVVRQKARSPCSDKTRPRVGSQNARTLTSPTVRNSVSDESATAPVKRSVITFKAPTPRKKIYWDK